MGAIDHNRSEPDWHCGRFGEPPLPIPEKKNAVPLWRGGIESIAKTELCVTVFFLWASLTFVREDFTAYRLR